MTPVLVAALYRASIGLDTDRAACPTSPTAANYLYMIDGDVPDRDRARALEQYLILGIDHGFNASTFTARVVDFDRCRRGRGGRRRARVRSRARCTVAPRAAPSTRSTPSAAPDNTEAWVRTRSPTASASWASVTPSTGPPTLAR